MNMKSYFKGLGIGIVVTAIILILARNLNNIEMSDSDVIKRAKELGMVESTTLTPSSLNNNDINDGEKIDGEDLTNNLNDSIKEDENNLNATDENDNSLENNLNATDENDESLKENNQNSSDKDESGTINSTKDSENIQEMVIITIKSGEGSEIVAGKVREAGFTDDGASFNKYLVENGYDKKLKIGDHEIPKDASFDEIAKSLCGIQ